MNANCYDRVVEVKKYIKKPWPMNSLNFSLKEDMSKRWENVSNR